MLVTLAITSSCFSNAAILQIEDRFGAQAILDALLQNAVVLTPETNFPAAICNSIASLNAKLGQQLSILGAEVLKDNRRCTRKIMGPQIAAGTVPILLAAIRFGVDAVICASAEEVVAVKSALGARPVEVLLLADYPNSITEKVRRSFLVSQELHLMQEAQCQRIIGRAIGLGERIVIADKMIGRAGKDGVVKGQLRRFTKGVVYVAKCACSMNSGRAVEVEIISMAGGTGAPSGYVDPKDAEKAIRQAMTEADQSKLIGTLRVTLKTDTEPPVFRDRLLACAGRCWGIRHGMDDFGALILDPTKRSPTYLDPDCLANRRLLNQIINLKNI